VFNPTITYQVAPSVRRRVRFQYHDLTTDGYELAQRFRADERLRSVVLVALTGYASPGDRSRATAAGFDYHFSKSLDLNQFREIVGELHAASSRPAD
jgi:CheY-like chemotaxis protein